MNTKCETSCVGKVKISGLKFLRLYKFFNELLCVPEKD